MSNVLQFKPKTKKESAQEEFNRKLKEAKKELLEEAKKLDW